MIDSSVSTNGAFAESYTWDALGRRATTTTAEGTVRHVYDGNQCIADLDETGAVIRSYVWGPGIDNLLAIRTGGATYYALTDHQNTVHGFVDASGALVAHYVYDAWGNVLESSVSVPALADNRYLFQGREYSWATGFYNFRARWYDPATGRWLSKDPIGISGGMNLYVFCGNSPVLYRDPLGAIQYKNGDEILDDIKYWFDATEEYSSEHWWFSGKAFEYGSIFAFSGGPWGKYDFKANDPDSLFRVGEETMRPDEFGNFVAGFQAGYGRSEFLLEGVLAGGVIWARAGKEERPDDSDSYPAIAAGYMAGKAARDAKQKNKGE